MAFEGEKKTICFSLPCYNEKDNIIILTEKLIELCNEKLPNYHYILQFIDNCSTDGTKDLLRGLCEKYSQVRVIFNARNFPLTSGYYGILQTEGDCTISMPTDFQIPLDVIPSLVKKWEQGAKVVCLVKESSEEKKRMWSIRQTFYKISEKLSDSEVISNYSGSGLYDKQFLDVCRKIDDPIGSFIQMVTTLGWNIEKISYRERQRKSGKSKNNFFTLFDIAILRFVNLSSAAPRIAMLVGVCISGLSIICSIVTCVFKLLYWQQLSLGGLLPALAVFLVGGIQLFFVGLIGEYSVKSNTRLMKRPMVVEESRINFQDIK